MLRRSLYLMLVALIAPSAHAQTLPDSAARARREWFILDAPAQWFGDSRASLVAHLGRPDSLSYETVKNLHDSLSTDTIVTLHYDSATFVIYAVARTRNEILLEASIASARYLRQSPLPYGAPLAQVRKYFGDAATGDSPHLVYYCVGCLEPVTGSGVEFWFQAGRLSRVRWEHTID